MAWIGVDIGGSHISAAQIGLEDHEVKILAFHEADVDTSGRAPEIISAWSSLIRLAIGNHTEVELGIAMPGPYDYVNGISLIKDQGKMKALYDLSVKQLLAESLNIKPENIFFTNDAEAFLIGESFAGASRGFTNALGLTLGTGLGSAIKIHDKVKDGKLWTAPFRDGIAEDYLGTAWFRKFTLEQFGLTIDGVKDLLAPDFDPAISNEIFSEFGYSLGEFLAQYMIRLHCQGVVLGGKIARAGIHFFTLHSSLSEQIGLST
ncbi:ROK family protein [Algoriphagus boritolerans]|uniref:ROK family protein n=1 Tax=Algoriphagus boritolerans TaxID=308111 RepID=UPI000A5C1A88